MKEEFKIHWHLIIRHEPISKEVMQAVVLPALAEEFGSGSTTPAPVIKKVRK